MIMNSKFTSNRYCYYTAINSYMFFIPLKVKVKFDLSGSTGAGPDRAGVRIIF